MAQRRYLRRKRGGWLPTREQSPRGSGRGPRSREHAFALQIDQLLGLGNRKGDGIIAAGVGIGPNEAVLLHAIGGVLLDAAGRLVLAARQVGRGSDAVALVFDRFDGRAGGGTAGGKTGPEAFELREPGWRPLLGG